MKVPQTRYKINEFYGDNNYHANNYLDDRLSRNNPFSFAEANLNSQWALSTNNGVNAQAGADYTVVMSNSNYNVHNSTATMYVHFDASYDGSMTFKIMNRAEGNYDYPTITLENGTTLYSNKALTTTFTSFTVPSGEHTMTVVFRKDGSNNTDLDRAFLAMPSKVTITL